MFSALLALWGFSALLGLCAMFAGSKFLNAGGSGSAGFGNGFMGIGLLGLGAVLIFPPLAVFPLIVWPLQKAAKAEATK